MKTRKVLEINACGNHIKGYYEEGKVHPWRLYRLTWSLRKDHCGCSQKREMIGKWENLISMLQFVSIYYKDNAEAWK